MQSFRIEDRHDFASKLRQESEFGRMQAYINWQRAVRDAKVKGLEAPRMPQGWGPLSLNLDLTTACNYACTHCIDWDMLNSRAKYDHEILMKSLWNLIERGLRSVILIGGGEPTLYPKFGDVVRFLKEHEVQVGIVSNGSRNEKICEIAPVLVKKDWVRFSLDSGTEKTFAAMHQPKKPIGLEKICSFVPRIRELNPLIAVGFSYIIVWGGAEREAHVKIIPNIGEMVAAAKLAREHSFTYISFKPFLTRHPDGAEVMDTAAVLQFNETVASIREALSEAKLLETEGFKVVESTNLRVLLEGNWRDYTRQPHMCHMMAFRQVLSPLGLYNCPAHRGETKARMGDPTSYRDESSITEFERSTTRMLETFDAMHECREVTCLYHSANHMLEGLIDGTLNAADVEALPDREDYFL
ncbi:hypothetical protein A2943_00075 [Candidatus Adlerbacteria bacterium RIFCSPLOWO2_01_FULL_51_16]|uniref:Radical SAM core domain-containing protein n=1 Tax=Candidatus Adlerbacteria bacterium RIFCSPLOWO2_01_FULL_51_16 TaxID=1797243 RepID=A0A1F4XF11_9BACT|nr:MAG: hypothetical protein A2943_00075 [Candidatus Adlerbacteria bacterium RIFCSPLOWO2_01_FULL_51_16]